ncbi:MAG: SPASM domain-containing protein [Xanthobacteraceae bacterium]
MYNGPPTGFDPADIAPRAWREFDWPVFSLALDVSGQCNLGCLYCAEAATMPKARSRMSEEVLDAALACLMSDGQTDVIRTIRLGSGEPLLALPLLRLLAAKLRAMGPAAPKVFLTTNGSRLSAGTMHWLVGTEWTVKISLDGPADIHDRWRPDAKGAPTHAKISAAVGELARRIPDRLAVTAVLCRGTDPKRVFEAIAALGVRRIEMLPVVTRQSEMLPDRDDVAAYARFVENYCEDWFHDKPQPRLIRLADMMLRAMGYNVSQVVCGAARGYYGVGADGGLYPCVRFIGIEDYRIGHVSDGIYADAARDFRANAGRPYEERGACAACWAAPLCNGPCFACSELMGPGDGSPFALHCDYFRIDAWNAAALVARMRSTPERLAALLPGVSI